MLLTGQRLCNEMSSHSWFWRVMPGHGIVEPTPHVLIQPDAVHVVVERFVQRLAEAVVVDAGGVDEFDVIGGEADRRQRLQLDTVFGRVEADRRVDGAGEAVEEAGLDAAFGEQLADVFKRIDGVLHGLRREAVHQVGVDEHAGIGEGAGNAGNLVNRDAFFHQRQQAVGGDFEAAGDGDAAAVGELVAEFRREGFFKADVAPPGNRPVALLQFVGQRLEGFRRGGFVDEESRSARFLR
jgi:hypothetical protein